MTIHIFGFYRASVINKLTRYNAKEHAIEPQRSAADTNHKTLKRAAIFYGQCFSGTANWLSSSSSSSALASFHLCAGIESNANAQTDKCRRTRKVKVNFISFYLFIYPSNALAVKAIPPSGSMLRI